MEDPRLSRLAEAPRAGRRERSTEVVPDSWRTGRKGRPSGQTADHEEQETMHPAAKDRLHGLSEVLLMGPGPSCAPPEVYTALSHACRMDIACSFCISLLDGPLASDHNDPFPTGRGAAALVWPLGDLGPRPPSAKTAQDAGEIGDAMVLD